MNSPLLATNKHSNKNNNNNNMINNRTQQQEQQQHDQQQNTATRATTTLSTTTWSTTKHSNKSNNKIINIFKIIGLWAHYNYPCYILFYDVYLIFHVLIIVISHCLQESQDSLECSTMLCLIALWLGGQYFELLICLREWWFISNIASLHFQHEVLS